MRQISEPLEGGRSASHAGAKSPPVDPLDRLAEELGIHRMEAKKIAINSALAILSRVRRGARTYVIEPSGETVEIVHTSYGVEAPRTVPVMDVPVDLKTLDKEAKPNRDETRNKAGRKKRGRIHLTDDEIATILKSGLDRAIRQRKAVATRVKFTREDVRRIRRKPSPMLVPKRKRK
jgi:hypothetical protein